MKTFLLIGLDPQALADATAATLSATIADMQRQFAARGNRLDLCVVKLDGSAEAPVTAQLARATYDCAFIGGGIREPDAHLELLERIVNALHHQAPGTAIGFVREPAAWRRPTGCCRPPTNEPGYGRRPRWWGKRGRAAGPARKARPANLTLLGSAFDFRNRFAIGLNFQ